MAIGESAVLYEEDLLKSANDCRNGMKKQDAAGLSALRKPQLMAGGR